LVLASVLGSLTVIQAFLNGDHSDTTIATLAGMVLAIYKVMDGRYNQATAAVTAAPVVFGPTAPTEEELTATYPGDPPPPIQPSGL